MEAGLISWSDCLQNFVAGNDDGILQVSQLPGKGKGIAEDGDSPVVRNLTNDFDGSTSDRAILVGRGYPSDGDSQDTPILGIVLIVG